MNSAAKLKDDTSSRRRTLGSLLESVTALTSARVESGVRRVGGWVSGSSSITAARTTTAKIARNQKMLRQLDQPSSQPPTMGARAGATPKIIDICDMARWAGWPENTSRTTVRPTIMPPPAKTP